MQPERIVRSRARGWRMPENTVSVARPSKWGNPFRVGDEITKFPYREVFGPVVRDRAHAVEIFESYARITSGYDLLVRQQLRGLNLACYCPSDEPCHADTLLRLANEVADADA